MSGHQASTQPGTASGEEEETCPPTVAAGTPAQMQGTAAGSLPPLATVVHTSYAPAPATGIPVDGNPFYPGVPTGVAGGGGRGGSGGGLGHGQPQHQFYPSFAVGGGNQQQQQQQQLQQLQQYMSADRGGTTTVVMPEGGGLVEHVVARQLSRSLKLFSFIDILLCLLYVFAGYLFTAFAVIGPICGYYGAKNYLRNYILCYVVFCFINMCWRLAVFIMAESLTAQILGFLMVFIEIYITRLVIRFYKLLRGFSDDDLNLLRALEHMPVQMVYW